ncbi:hypothetical protein UR09_00030 [Candidatus Nitromaritima sp. SCGC AAA799-A02]|nr:hypothetical protein UR09_00030 [Candidatus Nitromaritima sp. SCGC AAA799-A02]
MKTPIYIAGHLGLIGSAFLRRFRKEGVENIITASRNDLDLFNPTAVKVFFSKYRPKTIFLAAGKVGGILTNRDYPADFINQNLAIQLNVFQAAHESGADKLVFFGSSCMYPRQCPQPMDESMLLTGVPEPTSMAYAMAKLSGTYTCLAYNQQLKRQLFIPVIPNNAYGPNDNFDPNSSHVLSALIKKFHDAKEQKRDSVTLWGTGSPRREFVHADDIVDACLTLLKPHDNELELPINIGSGKDVSMKELAETIRTTVGYHGTIQWDTSKPDGAPQKLLDNSRIRSLEWKPEIELEEGIKQTYKWYLNHLREMET